MESMFGIDLLPRLTASILTVAMVMGGGLLVLRRRRADDRFTLRAWLGLEMDSYLPCKEKASESSNDLPNVIINDFTTTKLDPNIHDLIEKVTKKEINSQQAAAMLDLLKKSEPKQRKKRHCNGVAKKKEDVKHPQQEADVKPTVATSYDDETTHPISETQSVIATVTSKEEQYVKQGTQDVKAAATSTQEPDVKSTTQQTDLAATLTILEEDKAKHPEREIHRLEAAVTTLEKKNQELKQTIAKLVKSEESWKEQIKVLYVQLAAVSKYASKLKWVIEKSKKSSKAANSLDSSTFQCQIETHYDSQKVNITSS